MAINSLKPTILGGSRSFKVIDVGPPERSSSLLVMISSKSVYLQPFSC